MIRSSPIFKPLYVYLEILTTEVEIVLSRKYLSPLQEVWVLSMKLTLTALTVAASLLANSASAFDPDDLQKLKDTNECVACDLRGAILTGANLAGSNLEDANLSSANLEGADLRLAGLEDANLSSANLTDADLRYAEMNGVIFCNTTMPDGSVIYSGC